MIPNKNKLFRETWEKVFYDTIDIAKSIMILVKSGIHMHGIHYKGVSTRECLILCIEKWLVHVVLFVTLAGTVLYVY